MLKNDSLLSVIMASIFQPMHDPSKELGILSRTSPNVHLSTSSENPQIKDRTGSSLGKYEIQMAKIDTAMVWNPTHRPTVTSET